MSPLGFISLHCSWEASLRVCPLAAYLRASARRLPTYHARFDSANANESNPRSFDVFAADQHLCLWTNVQEIVIGRVLGTTKPTSVFLGVLFVPIVLTGQVRQMKSR